MRAETSRDLPAVDATAQLACEAERYTRALII